MNLEPDDRLNLAERVLLNNAAKSNPGLPQETLRNLALSDAKGIKCETTKIVFVELLTLSMC